MLQQSGLMEKIEESLAVIAKHISGKPEIGIILGTGLGKLAEEIETEAVISYEKIPNFPVSTVESHSGKLLYGNLSGKKVVAMQGRFHLYEGYSMKQITYPVRVMKQMGAGALIISNACGSLNPYFRKGDIMLIDDHINLLGGNPLAGPNEDKLGPRFPDMSEPYSKKLALMAEQTAIENGISLKKGVYAALPGPSLETRAEYRFLRVAGADVVGMSTVPENIVARHMNMEVLGLSIITDECYPEALKPVQISEILEAAGRAEPHLTAIVKGVAKKL